MTTRTKRFSEIIAVLGATNIGSPKNEDELIKEIRRGFSVRSLRRLHRSTGLLEEQIRVAIGVSTRSLHRMRSAESTARFKPDASERMLRLSSAMIMATDLFGSKEKALEWMQQENRAIKGDRPIDRLDTAIGYDTVMQVLGRIEHGVYS